MIAGHGTGLFHYPLHLEAQDHIGPSPQARKQRARYDRTRPVNGSSISTTRVFAGAGAEGRCRLPVAAISAKLEPGPTVRSSPSQWRGWRYRMRTWWCSSTPRGANDRLRRSSASSAPTSSSKLPRSLFQRSVSRHRLGFRMSYGRVRTADSRDSARCASLVESGLVQPPFCGRSVTLRLVVVESIMPCCFVPSML